MQDGVIFVVLVVLTSAVMEIQFKYICVLFARCGLAESLQTAGGKQI